MLVADGLVRIWYQDIRNYHHDARYISGMSEGLLHVSNCWEMFKKLESITGIGIGWHLDETQVIPVAPFTNMVKL